MALACQWTLRARIRSVHQKREPRASTSMRAAIGAATSCKQAASWGRWPPPSHGSRGWRGAGFGRGALRIERHSMQQSVPINLAGKLRNIGDVLPKLLVDHEFASPFKVTQDRCLA